jgi:hypothetical protein
MEMGLFFGDYTISIFKKKPCVLESFERKKEGGQPKVLLQNLLVSHSKLYCLAYSTQRCWVCVSVCMYVYTLFH